MLSRSNRLKKSDQAGEILKSGDMAVSRLMVARFRKNTINHHRFSVIVSQKIDKHATQRNRLRRQIYEIIRLNMGKLTTAYYFDILILPKKAIIGTTYDEMEQHFLKLLPFLK